MSVLDRDEIALRGHTVWAEIDLAAIRHNVKVLRALTPASELMGVVKGYAYGHGNPASARAILDAGATRLGVARVAEALHLRDAGIEVPIHVFSEPPLEAIPAMIDARLTPAVYSERFARALSAEAESKRATIPVHVKLDTGMHRVGLLADDIPAAMDAIRKLPGIEIEGAWSHLAVADVPDHPFTRKQLELFEDLTGQIERLGVRLRYKHVANSAATMSLPESHYDMVRCGVAAFGLWPGRDLVGTADLRPAMVLRARISMSKLVPGGDALSYGLRYELARTSRVVTVAAGYADGYDRRLGGGGDILIAGRRYRVSGTVCMDQFMVDIGAEEVGVGSVATLMGRDRGENVSAEELADRVGTINYEITTRVASRVPRLYVDGDSSE